MQVIVLFWSHDVEYEAYLRGIALADPLINTPLFELTHWIGVIGWVLYPAFLGQDLRMSF